MNEFFVCQDCSHADICKFKDKCNDVAKAITKSISSVTNKQELSELQTMITIRLSCNHKQHSPTLTARGAYALHD